MKSGFLISPFYWSFIFCDLEGKGTLFNFPCHFNHELRQIKFCTENWKINFIQEIMNRVHPIKNFKINNSKDLQGKIIIWVTSDCNKFRDAILILIVFIVARDDTTQNKRTFVQCLTIQFIIWWFEVFIIFAQFRDMILF